MAEGCDKESLENDVQDLLAQWDTIKRYAEKNSAPCLIHRDLGLLERVLRDDLTEDIDEIVVILKRTGIISSLLQSVSFPAKISK